jgi:hypothetical protein
MEHHINKYKNNNFNEESTKPLLDRNNDPNYQIQAEVVNHNNLLYENYRYHNNSRTNSNWSRFFENKTYVALLVSTLIVYAIIIFLIITYR